MGHIVLLGDSIFDNAAYTRGEPDVTAHLRRALPASWRATLCAVDGATTLTMAPQLDSVPRNATHLVVSVGGNDALSNIDLLLTPVGSTSEALTMFANRVRSFESSYQKIVETILGLRKPVTLCTIYNGWFPDPQQAVRARVALMLFNDVIVRTAFALRTGIIDLRFVCADATDFANAIEPSGRGGLKIANAIARAAGAADDSGKMRVVIG